MVRRGKALRRSIGLVGAPLPVAFDHLLRRDGNTSATAIARKPPHGPMRAESREPRTPDLGRAMALRIIPPMAVHGATSLQRRTTEVRRRPASLPRPTTTRPRAAEELRRQGRTQLQARAIPLRDRIQASAVSAAAELPRRDRTRLPARAILLRDLLPLRAHPAAARVTPAYARAETRDLREAIRAGAEDTTGSRAGFPDLPGGGPFNRARRLGELRSPGKLKHAPPMQADDTTWWRRRFRLRETCR